MTFSDRFVRALLRRGVALGVLALAASLSVVGCGGNGPSQDEIAQERIELAKILSAEVVKSERERSHATQSACRSQVGKALSLLNEHTELPLIVADVTRYSRHLDEINTELERVPRGSLDSKCLGVLRELDTAAARRLEAAQTWTDNYTDYGIFFDIVLGDCARAKPDKAKCDTDNLDIDDEGEFAQLVMRNAALLIRIYWREADAKVRRAENQLDAMGSADPANPQVPRSKQAVDGSVIGKAAALLCSGDAVPSDAVEPCQDLRDVLIQGVVADEESDLNKALSGVVDAYQLRPSG